MKLNKGAMIALALGALALPGCSSESSEAKNSAGNEIKGVGDVGMALTLPDGSSISSVSYTLTGPDAYSRTGTVSVGSSSTLTFRIGGVPTGNGYTIALSATTAYDSSCAGTATFNVTDASTTRVSVLLTCGAVDNVADVIVDGTFSSCPLVVSAGAIPAEANVGGTIALTSAISHGSTPVLWTGTGGTFANANANDTNFTCETVGTHVLTVTINGAQASCNSSQTVSVECTLAPGCGNGQVNVGEECDDGNQLNTDACTNNCRDARCGDGFTGPGEECDDGNAVDTDACANACTENECGNNRVDPGEQCDGTPNCSPTTCRELGCGDGVVTAPETCDDGNTVDTDECKNNCTAGTCGDGVVRTVGANPEQCDDGNTVNDDACRNDCTNNVIPGDIPQQTVAACRTCRQANCSDYQGLGLDLVAGCFGANADPNFAQDCIDAKNCAYENDCGFNATGLAQCFCGSQDLGVCQTQGGNGPCKPEIQAAARTDVLADIIGNFGFFGVPLGFATYLTQCDVESCASSCAP